MNQRCGSSGRGDFAAHRGTTNPVFVHAISLSTINPLVYPDAHVFCVSGSGVGLSHPSAAPRDETRRYKVCIALQISNS
jgi:hypothetical protein